MSREVRMVPKDWEHPKDKNDRYQPMFDECYETVLKEWTEEKKQWDNGFKKDWTTSSYVKKEDKYKEMPFEEWAGDKPDPKYYMPKFDEKERTHYMMYETTSEGTPMSPAFETPEELARWLTDNNASAFASMKTTYEKWLKMI